MCLGGQRGDVLAQYTGEKSYYTDMGTGRGGS